MSSHGAIFGWDGQPFSGSKIALIIGDTVLAYKRDEKPEIPFPGMWDLPGGGREGEESPSECAIRELYEEFSINCPPEAIHWERQYSALHGSLPAYFFVGSLTKQYIDAIIFGSEGQYWQLFSIKEFVNHPEVIWQLKARFRDYLAASGAGARFEYPNS